jgi:hypothetical protein
MIPALIPVLFVFTLPESPRYLLQQAINAGRAAGKDQHDGKDSTRNTQRRNRLIGKAYKALASLNCLDVQAWRELFRIYDSLNENEETNDASAWYPEIHRMWKENRARNGLLASAAVMFMQQLCGINVMVYYYTSFLDEQMNGTDETTKDPYLVSFGHPV